MYDIFLTRMIKILWKKDEELEKNIYKIYRMYSVVQPASQGICMFIVILILEALAFNYALKWRIEDGKKMSLINVNVTFFSNAYYIYQLSTSYVTI